MSENQMDKDVYEAAKAGDAAQVKQLLENGGSLGFRDVFGMQAHHVAARHGHALVVEAIFATTSDNGTALLNSVTNDNKQVLHYAAAFGHVKLARTLLAYGANPEAHDKWGNRPIDLVRLRFEKKKMTDEEYKAIQAAFAPYKKAQKPPLGNIPYHPKSPFSQS
ncbi:MAG TPA: hypothetical protein DCW68_03445 [Rhodospirillaceae bacterium]|nr:MAG: hypothetical protein A2018_06415 [Alphaproteobacteria bacterium GWF2_58_20]HAU29148.1 hypothetical protein [Rhodospirillaceae bacterium]